MRKPEEIYENVIKALRTVIDPETGADVYRMRLVQDIQVYSDGKVEYAFSPSSPLCPIALPLILSIMDSIKGIEGVRYQNVTVKNYAGAEALNDIIASLPASKP
jgi:metal-sulfur cluster biosynthetic enzyme